MTRAAGVAVAGAALLLAALTFASTTLFVPALALLVLPALIVLWIRFAWRGASVERVVGAERVLEDEPVEARIVLRGRLGLPGAELHDPLTGGSIGISTALWTRQVQLRVLARFPTRGRIMLPPPELRLGDQLGLIQVSRTGSDAHQELLVLPRTERVSWRPGAGRGTFDNSDDGSSPEPVGATEPDGLRQYQLGTPASRIHWPALARGAGLLERRLLADSESSRLVVLDSRCPAPGPLLDAAVRAAASLVLELGRRYGCDLLLPGHRRLIHVGRDLGSWPAAHAQLALVAGGPEAPGPALASRSHPGPVFYVAADPRSRPAAGTGRVGVTLVLPSALAAVIERSPSFEVSGCTGFLLDPNTRRVRRGRSAGERNAGVATGGDMAA
jgi:uncharacterized protein (DUF58 family)